MDSIRERDRANLSDKAKYLSHKDDGCKECKAMNKWLDTTIKALSK